MMLRFSSFGKILGYHDENCMEKTLGIVLPKNSEFSENSDLSPWPQRVPPPPKHWGSFTGLSWLISWGMNNDYG